MIAHGQGALEPVRSLPRDTLLLTMIGTQDCRTRSVSNDVEQQTRLA
jgi:hypothetical protein